MSKVINTVCDGCESEYSLSFNEDLVVEHEKLRCPFCSEIIESFEEDVVEEFDDFMKMDQDDWD